ncbi:TIR-NBS-LRR resistance protein [Trifolium pratense]|uniref:ADP-ribosyl cyclase/cyclic ADP-ribose hydrolase n=1 Tax=Trifolium pratense TaxID=57577 RepID=A0A2K3P9T3_TRIPR|nr:TIR-NBS-LRR resistance protein [Trifolium pratense]PNY15963.1 TIR-NBS-LRR resistance protein [Trifolium pratense]PNY16443.1 TIR-NBS-LRR resistance protein [Trifolium pratense]
MASSSNDSTIESSCNNFSSAMNTLPNTNDYDVFVSFRGKDTRHSFTDHLFGALRRKGILAFRDDTALIRGKSIAPELLRAIESSKIYVIVFSENYASSTWCLQELENIIQCEQRSGKGVLPVFYDVDPSVVRLERGYYVEALAEHENYHDPELVQRWRVALAKVANLAGWHMRNMPQYEEIEKIVQEIIRRFGYKFSCLANDLVGTLTPIAELEKCLLLNSISDVRAVGICGMGGVGKTTIASLLYGKISHQFNACCFIDDVSQFFKYYGPLGVQKQILHQTLGEEHKQIYNHYDGTNLIQSRLRRLKALIVFDNVDQSEQLEKLALYPKVLGEGSRIIIVCRDSHILKEYEVDALYKVQTLNDTNSLQLFCRKAFKLDNIKSVRYKELTHDILNIVDGLPLAIKVLGSFLFDRTISEWRSALIRLKENPNKDIMDALQLSIYGLEKVELQIFLDIACFFDGKEEKYVKNVLNCCGFHPDIGLRVLVDKSLISISDESKIEMHGMLKELGRKIVQENSKKEARKWSRLWLHKYCYDVMSENMEKNVEAIVLEGDTEILMAEALSNMSRLRLLILKDDVKVLGSLTNLSNQLRYVEWNVYPFIYFPSSFQPDRLVELILVGSNIKQLWEGKKNLPNLRILDLSHSKNLSQMSAFGEAPNLERLNLEGCVKLMHLDLSIDPIKLVFLNLKNCKSLICIPNGIFDLNSLENLNICSCSMAFTNPRLSELPSLANLSCLREVDISFCSLSQLTDTIRYLSCLQRLNLGGNNFVTLPSMRELSKLVYLSLEHCKLLESLPDLPLHAAIERNEYLRAGMYIFNCPKLLESETKRCSDITCSWMKQFILANQESFASSHWIEFVIPGNEMPSWFNDQKMATSIRIDPSLIIHNNNVIGIVCCVLFSTGPNDEPSRTKERKAVLHLSFQRGDFVDHYRIQVHTNLIMVRSTHMWLTYFTRESFSNILRDIGNEAADEIRMEVSIVEGEDLNVEVKNCGYLWIFSD